ncbi:MULTISPECIES: CaiB/BaiF CoA transferase family protein [Nonomuraea]|uniref:CaiB/BaiF CoA-transferase family protein n=1 Tax=Nonomuraea ferruginea TaxID=46174 RepID=A0ABT4SYJ5_9ACTN|nr:CaiB/BaiF CoA-transferase family protein [Nonomuraea ferruginea]MDA0642224.1 CaiB/BaiF CoA-transferase family protein [Nonomuraea ferruginea]
MTRPLDGVLVVSMEQAVSAPYATRQLADLGARVIKVERPDGGDFARAFDTHANGTGAHFAWANRNKESLALDVKTPGGRRVVGELLARADVFTHNLVPGAAARLGLDGASLRAAHPRLVVCEISGYGTGGPYDGRKAYDLLVQAESGLTAITGSPEEPVKPGISVADIAAGMFAFSSVLAALLRRSATGEGCVLEVSMLDAMADWMGYPLVVRRHGTQPALAPGMSHPAIAPYDAYRAADGRLVTVSVQNDREWAKLAASVLGRPELADDPRYATNQARVAHRDVIDGLVADAIGAMDADRAVAALHAAGIGCGLVNDLAAVVDHPQLVARDRWLTVPAPAGPVSAPLPPPVTAAWQPPTGPVPGLGEHTEAVLRELGYDAAAIAKLRAEGAVRTSEERP